MAHAYLFTNRAAGLAATAFTWSNGATANRSYLNDGRMDQQMAVGSVASGVNVIIDLGGAYSITAVAILNSNIGNAASPTLKVEHDDDGVWGAGTVEAKAASSLNVTAPSHKDHVLQFASVAKRYWRLTWTWSGSFNMSIGELYLGASTSLARIKVYGHGESEEYRTTRLVTSTGETRGHFLAGPIRVKRLPFSDLTLAQRDELLAMFRNTKGGANPVLWIESAESVATAAAAAQQECVWGRLAEDEFSWTESDFGLYSPNELVLRSLGRELGA